LTPTIAEDRWISTADLATLLDIPRDTVYTWSKTGRGPARYAIGRQNRYRLSEVLAWIESTRVTA